MRKRKEGKGLLSEENDEMMRNPRNIDFNESDPQDDIQYHPQGESLPKASILSLEGIYQESGFPEVYY